MKRQRTVEAYGGLILARENLVGQYGWACVWPRLYHYGLDDIL